jgi:hypothetical protein
VSLPSAAALAGALLDAGIETPDGLARYLSGFDPRDARGYSQALWNAICVVHVSNTSRPDWNEIYAQLDAKGNASDSIVQGDDEDEEDQEADTAGGVSVSVLIGREDEDEEDQEADTDQTDEVANVKQWAEEVGEEIAGIEGILDALKTRQAQQADLTGAVDEMRAALESVRDGEMPSDSWRLDLIRNQGDETAGGRRSFSIAIYEEGIDLNSAVIDWQPGELDCCSGDEFKLRPGTSGHGVGDFVAFVGEFEEAVANSDYMLTVHFNEEEIGVLPQVALSDSDGEKIAKRCIRALAEDLQGMPDTLSGDGSVLENIWDEICAQKQIEESYFWEVYETTVRALIGGAVEELPHDQQVHLWLLTDPGEDWEADKESPDELPSPCDADLVDFLFGRLMSLASDYLNQRIIRYRDRPTD